MSDYISTKEIARIYNIDEETARRWCRTGKVEAKRIGKRWFIKADSHIIEENKNE